MFLPLFLLAGLGSHTLDAPVWEPALEGALARAEAEDRVIFLAVNIDDEPGNDRMLEAYGEELILEAAAGTVNLIASAFDHGSGDGACGHLGSVTCAEHQAIEKAVRSKYLEVDARGNAISPQHVFLRPDGEILLAVAWEVTAAELAWCFANAAHRLKPEGEFQAPAGTRAPRRLSVGGQPAAAKVALQPLSDAELKQTIAEMKKDWAGALRSDGFYRLLVTDHKDAIKFVRREIDNGILGMIPDLQVSTLERMAEWSPPSFWEASAPLLKAKEPQVRSAAALALEQLASAKSVKALKSAATREKEVLVKKNMLRALGTAGADDRSARSTLIKAAGGKDAILRRNALLALGSHLHESADEVLAENLASADPGDRQAAALAMAFGRRSHQRAALTGAIHDALGEEGALMERALAVIDGASLRTIAEDIRVVGRDTKRRVRFFGPAKDE